MAKKIHGGVKPGVFVERDVTFVTITFSTNVTTSAFGIPGSCVDKAVGILLQQKATVLGVSQLYSTGTKLDVMLGNASGWTSDSSGVIFNDVNVTGVLADLTTTLSATADIVFSKFEALPAASVAAGVDGNYRPA